MPETIEPATPEALVMQARRDARYLKSKGKLRPPGLPKGYNWIYQDYSEVCNRCIEMANEVCEAEILEAEAEENGEPITDETLSKIVNALYEMLSTRKPASTYATYQQRQTKSVGSRKAPKIKGSLYSLLE